MMMRLGYPLITSQQDEREHMRLAGQIKCLLLALIFPPSRNSELAKDEAKCYEKKY